MAGLFSLFLLLISLSFGDVSLPDEGKTIGTYIPNITIETHEGKRLSLKEIAKGKVLVLNPIYTKCSSACPLMTEGLKRTIKGLKEKVVVLSLTFDPGDDLEDLRSFKETHRLPENWYVARSREVDKLLSALDYRYRYEEGLKEYEHPNLYVVLTPSLRVSRYIYGVNPKLRDLELAVLEAKREVARLSPLEGLWLRCFRFNRESGGYEIDWFFVLSLAGGLLTFTLVPAVVWGGDAYALFRRRFISKQLLT